jgi:signal transduction histidine kinase
MRRHLFSKTAIARAAICACLIVETAIAAHGQYGGLQYGLALAYLVNSALGLLGDVSGWRASIRSLYALPYIDVLALVVLGFLSLVSVLHPFVPGLQFALVLLSLRERSIVPGRAALRYGLALGAIACSAIAAWLSDGHLNEARSAHLVALVAVTALTVSVASRFIPAKSVRPFVIDESSGNTDVLGEAAAYAMAQVGSNSAMLIWQNPERATWELRAFGLAAEQAAQDLDFVLLSKLSELKPMIFDLRGNAFMAVAENGSSVREQRGVPNSGLWRRLEIAKGLLMPVGEEAERAYLVLQTLNRSRWQDLIAATRICREITNGMRLHHEAMAGREAAISRLRNVIARDLHDSVAQTLAGSRLMLSAIANDLHDDQKKRDLESIRTALTDEGASLRLLIRQLGSAPGSGMRHDVIYELKNLLKAAGSRWKVAAKLEESQFRLLVPDWLSLEIQQLVREAISNGVRHGCADKVSVTCNRRRGEICLSISDNGKGFDVQTQRPPRSITERVAELSGTAEFHSKPGATQVIIRLPAIDF